MGWQSYGKAEPCLTSGGGAPNPPAIGFAQSFCSRISQISRRRFNGFTDRITRKPLKRLLGSERPLIHRAEAAV